MAKNWKTKLIHSDAKVPEGFRSLSVGVHRASTVLFPDATSVKDTWDQYEVGYTYGLYGTPTTLELAARVCELERGFRTLITPGGQGAISLINLAFLKAGDHVLLPEKELVGGSLDYFQWAAILRAVSAHTAYHWVYRTSMKPWLVADLLILRLEMPRSLISCYESIVRNLDNLARAHGRQGASQRQARGTYGRLETLSMESVFQGGLHEFVQSFISENNKLGALISEQYLF